MIKFSWVESLKYYVFHYPMIYNRRDLLWHSLLNGIVYRPVHKELWRKVQEQLQLVNGKLNAIKVKSASTHCQQSIHHKRANWVFISFFFNYSWKVKDFSNQKYRISYDADLSTQILIPFKHNSWITLRPKVMTILSSVISDTLWLHGLYPPVSSVQGILQARIVEWVAIPFSSGSSWPRDWTLSSAL